MRAMHWLAVIPLFVSATHASAALMPSFRLEPCSWEATHIVVVTEGDKIDGEVEVLESWKGDLKQGDKLSLPDLASFAPEKKRVVSKRFVGGDQDEKLPATVSGSRMVLFLIHKQGKPEEGKPANTSWLPASKWREMHASVTWIEGGKVFAFVQEINPGPLQLIWLGLEEKELKKKMDAVVKAQSTLTEAIRKGDEAKLTTTALELLKPEPTFVSHAAILDLGKVEKGLPALRAILKDEKLLQHHSTAVSSLRKAAGADAGPELVRVLEHELTFWKKVGPDLPKGWWNGAKGEIKRDEIERLRGHYDVAHSVVLELGSLRHASGREVVSEFGEYWKSLPQLVEVKQLADVCDATLKALPQK